MVEHKHIGPPDSQPGYMDHHWHDKQGYAHFRNKRDAPEYAFVGNPWEPHIHATPSPDASDGEGRPELDRRQWPWMHTHDGELHTHMCGFDDGHRHPESDVPASPGNEPAVFERLERPSTPSPDAGVVGAAKLEGCRYWSNYKKTCTERRAIDPCDPAVVCLPCQVIAAYAATGEEG